MLFVHKSYLLWLMRIMNKTRNSGTEFQRKLARENKLLIQYWKKKEKKEEKCIRLLINYVSKINENPRSE